MARHLRLTVPSLALALLSHGLGAAGLRGQTLPAALTAERDATRRHIRCELANASRRLGEALQRWPGGKQVAWAPVNGTCAVVGSSGVLKLHAHGKEIDRSARIFRFNDAPAGEGFNGFYSYMDMVGGREDLRIVNDAFPMKYLERSKRGERPSKEPAAYLVMPISWPPILPDLDEFAKAAGVRVYSLKPDAVLEAEKVMHSLFSAGWWSQLGQSKLTPLGSPSSGLLGALLAFSLCGETRLYGMPATRSGLTNEYHYYPSEENVEVPNANSLNQHQGFRAEKYLFRLLAANADLEASDVGVVEGLQSGRQDCTNASSIASAAATAPALPLPVDSWRRDFGTSD
uniref:Uncharacterized protein n=1 Tax=Alexandrium catenella TaxID=2925 RepID=A0A7S1MMQ1_ALECA